MQFLMGFALVPIRGECQELFPTPPTEDQGATPPTKDQGATPARGRPSPCPRSSPTSGPATADIFVDGPITPPQLSRRVPMRVKPEVWTPKLRGQKRTATTAGLPAQVRKAKSSQTGGATARVDNGPKADRSVRSRGSETRVIIVIDD